MKSFDESSSFYNEAINLIDLNDHQTAIKLITKNVDTIKGHDDIALAYLICGFLNDKLGDYRSSIDCFSKSIYFESPFEIIDERSKDIPFNARSNSRYKNGDYQGSIDDKRNAKKIRSLEIDRFPEKENKKINYKNLLLSDFIKLDLEPKYKILIKVSKKGKSKYDLIEDYKKVISNKKKEEIIRKLEFLSESKYNMGDYKASIRAIRRAERYY